MPKKLRYETSVAWVYRLNIQDGTDQVSKSNYATGGSKIEKKDLCFLTTVFDSKMLVLSFRSDFFQIKTKISETSEIMI